MRGIVTYMKRDFLKWTRGTVAVISALVMPAAWLVFVGLALPVKFTGNYLDFITPGILVMTMLSEIFSKHTVNQNVLPLPQMLRRPISPSIRDTSSREMVVPNPVPPNLRVMELSA